jgi:hypothetical protein
MYESIEEASWTTAREIAARAKSQISLEPERSEGDDWLYLAVMLDLYSRLVIG